jgi:hypothetical protein
VGSQGRALLDEVYATFSARSEDLLDAVSAPRALLGDGTGDRWTDLGDWLALASRLGAEKVLFVRDDPVAVFSDVGAAPSEPALGELYRRAWCMSEPRCLFVALPDELRVYSLNLPPTRGAPPGEPWRVLGSAADVLSLARDIDEFGPDLQGLMEAGSSAPARADRRLIDDLRHVRTHLEATGLSMAQAHALIGRSILVRYLEDRGVLTRSYFERVAGDNTAWRRALDTEGPTPVFGPSSKERLYDRVLCDAGSRTRYSTGLPPTSTATCSRWERRGTRGSKIPRSAYCGCSSLGRSSPASSPSSSGPTTSRSCPSR